jgi:hypothetical protein
MELTEADAWFYWSSLDNFVCPVHDSVGGYEPVICVECHLIRCQRCDPQSCRCMYDD